MILLDTDSVTLLKYPDNARARKLIDRLEAVPVHEAVGVTIVTVEERMRGWLAVVAREKSVLRQVNAYRELSQLFEFYQSFEVVPFDDRAANLFLELRQSKVRIGTRDLKIASIALANRALLVSSNLSDFKQVPGLNVENWLD